MTHHTTPAQAEGLYDPRFEHDACGVAMVARLDDEQTPRGRPPRAGGAGQPRAPRGRGRRRPHGRRRGHPRPAPATRSCARSPASSCPAPGRYGVGMCFLPHDPARPGQARGHDRAQRARRGPAGPGLARRAGRRGPRGLHRQRVAALRQAALRRRRRGPRRRPPEDFDQDAFERKLYVIRRIVELAAGPSFYAASLLLAHAGLQGDADLPPAAGLLPRPPGRALRQRAGARPLALLDEHVPELGPRPPVPRHRAQRRDQHAHGQRQLDARPRVAARLRALRARPAEDAPRRAPGRVGLGHLRQRPRAAHARRAARCPTRR